MTVTGPNTAIAVSDLRELEESAAKLEVAARKLPIGPGRDELFEDMARFRAQVAGLKARRFYGHQATAEGEGEMSPSPTITGLPWTQADDDQLRTLAAAGESCSIIAELSKRSHSSIRRRARMLKIKLARSRRGPKTKNTPRRIEVRGG